MPAIQARARTDTRKRWASATLAPKLREAADMEREAMVLLLRATASALERMVGVAAEKAQCCSPLVQPRRLDARETEGLPFGQEMDGSSVQKPN